MEDFKILNEPPSYSIHQLSNWQYQQAYQQQLVANSIDKYSENTKKNQKEKFQEEGRIYVKPLLDRGKDGGFLTPATPNQIPIPLIIVVSILVLWVIINSLLPLFRQRTPNEETYSEILEDNRADQFTHSEDKQSMTVTSESVAYPDNYNYTASEEEQLTINDNSSDLTPNQAEQERLRIKQIFDETKIDKKEVNTYE